MILAQIINTETQETETSIFYTWESLHKALFQPIFKLNICLELGRLCGGSYECKKADIQDKAILLSNMWGGLDDLSIAEYCTISNYFEKYGKRYGCLQEFHENGICYGVTL